MIYLIRHAESELNLQNRLTCGNFPANLTDRGRIQAQHAANWLKSKSIDAIITSPYDRARHTAGIIAQELGCKVKFENGLREMDCGSLDGTAGTDDLGQWASIFKGWLNADWNAAFPEGESFRQGADRFRSALKRCEESGTTLAVTHGGVARCILPVLCTNLDTNAARINNTGITILEPAGNDQYNCLTWNLLDHLGETI